MIPRWAVPPLLLAALLAPAAAHAQTAIDTTRLEPVLVELSVGRYGSRTVPAYRSSGDALLPVLQLAELAELGAAVLPDSAIELTLRADRQPVVLDPARWEVRGPDATLELTPADRLVKADDQYLSTRVLSRLLHVTFAVNWSELSVGLLDADSLPVGRRIARERAHALFRRAGLEGGPDLALARERTRWDGMVLDYSVLAPTQDLMGSGAWSAGLGANLLGGSLQGRLAST
ncbi:MAG TPA: hypothetical protein VL915_00960, partial [Gemmatimonadales bacterium]|nr:hypothetical protein [Gemmatimonadales bacterium]